MASDSIFTLFGCLSGTLLPAKQSTENKTNAFQASKLKMEKFYGISHGINPPYCVAVDCRYFLYFLYLGDEKKMESVILVVNWCRMKEILKMIFQFFILTVGNRQNFRNE